MRKSLATLLSFLFMISVPVNAGTLAGVSLPDSVQVGETTLVLNGLGLRKKFVVKVYVAGLYVSQKSSDANAILNAETPKRIVMHFVRDVSKSQIADAFDESFKNNAPEARLAAKSEIDALLATLVDVKAGDQIVFTYLPGKGTTFAMNGAEKLKVASPSFTHAVFSVWLGPKPPNADLKKGILGQ